MNVTQKNQADWDSYSAKYLRYKHSDRFIIPIVDNPSSAFEPEAWEQICQHFPTLQGRRVCVPSSGDHYAVLAFALLGAQVTSCDISLPQLQAGQRLLERFGLKASFIQADTMQLSGLPDDAFDLVYTSNGVHVWLDDLPAMYRNIHRIMKKEGVYIMCDVHPFQRPFGENLQVVKPYENVGPFEDEATINFAWRVQDFINAMAGSGLRIFHMEEMHDRKDYDYPFWLSLEDAVNGVTVDPAQVDRLYDWQQNPCMALPAWMCLTCRKD